MGRVGVRKRRQRPARTRMSGREHVLVVQHSLLGYRAMARVEVKVDAIAARGEERDALLRRGQLSVEALVGDRHQDERPR